MVVTGKNGTAISGVGNPLSAGLVKLVGPTTFVAINPGPTATPSASKLLGRPVDVSRGVGPGNTGPTRTEERLGIALLSRTTFRRFVLPTTTAFPKRFVLTKISFVVAPTITTLFGVRTNPLVIDPVRIRFVTGPMMITLLEVRTKRFVDVGMMNSTLRGERCAASVMLAARAAHKNSGNVFMALLRPPCLPYNQSPNPLFSTGVCPPTKRANVQVAALEHGSRGVTITGRQVYNRPAL